MNEGFGKDFYRKGNSVKRFGPFTEPPDSENLKVAVLIPFPKISSYPSQKRFWTFPPPGLFTPCHFPQSKRAQTRPITLSEASKTGFGGRTLPYVSPFESPKSTPIPDFPGKPGIAPKAPMQSPHAFPLNSC